MGLCGVTVGSVTSQWGVVIPSWDSVMSQVVSVASELGKTAFKTVFCDVTIGLRDVSMRVCVVKVRLFDFPDDLRCHNKDLGGVRMCSVTYERVSRSYLDRSVPVIGGQ